MIAAFLFGTVASAQLIDPPAATGTTEPLGITVHFPAIPFPADIDIDTRIAVEERIGSTALEMVAGLLQYGEVFGTYNVDLDANDLLSVTLTYSGYRAPMAHPMHVSESLTFDLLTGELLHMDDLLQGDYLTVLDAHIAAQIASEDLPLLRPFDGITSDQDFKLTPDGIVIFFQLYDLVPYAWGFPQFTVPYEALSNHIQEEYTERLLPGN